MFLLIVHKQRKFESSCFFSFLWRSIWQRSFMIQRACLIWVDKHLTIPVSLLWFSWHTLLMLCWNRWKAKLIARICLMNAQSLHNAGEFLGLRITRRTGRRSFTESSTKTSSIMKGIIYVYIGHVTEQWYMGLLFNGFLMRQAYGLWLFWLSWWFKRREGRHYGRISVMHINLR